jgi:hypothetical protein
LQSKTALLVEKAVKECYQKKLVLNFWNLNVVVGSEHKQGHKTENS